MIASLHGEKTRTSRSSGEARKLRFHLAHRRRKGNDQKGCGSRALASRSVGGSHCARQRSPHSGAVVIQVIYIYGLCDPSDHVVRYVGQTQGPKARLQVHISGARRNRDGNSAKNAWILALLEKGSAPEMVILEETTEEMSGTVETKWIEDSRAKGEVFNVGPGRNRNVRREGDPHIYGVRFTEEEAQMIEECARARGLKPATYIRIAALETARIHQRERLLAYGASRG